jgi:UDP-glucose 4-epimerase
MSTWLVTGGAGFIGSHLCDALVAAGDQVRVLDDLSTGKRDNLPAGVTLLEGDVADPLVLEAAVEDVDGCFHLAAIASVERGRTEWSMTHRTNLSATVGLFDAIARQRRKAPVVYASSAAVYGDCPTVPIPEDAACHPLSAYGADKYGCELHANVATHVHGIPTVGLRFFNVYGPRQDPGSPYSGVISIFCTRIRDGRPITIFGDGGQTRDFVYIADIVAALRAAMALRPPRALVFNVCTGEPTSVLELARLIAQLSGKRLELRCAEPRLGDIRHSLGRPDAARSALSLAVPTALSDGLAHVLTWMSERR